MISLTGSTLLILCAVLALGLPVLALSCWSRIRGPRLVRGIQRIGLLAGCQLATVLLVAVALNDYGEFYGTWHSLLRGSPGAVRVHSTTDGPGSGAGAAAGRVHQLPDAAFATPAQWPTRGRLESVTIRGANSALSMPAQVYLPPQYFQSPYVHSRFPAIEVLAGFGGAPGSLTGTRPYPQALLSLIAARHRAPIALVLLRTSAGHSHDGSCPGMPTGPQAQTLYSIDVPTQLAARYRLRTTGWGALGIGSGGYCAAKLAMTSPQTFSAAVTVDGAFSPSTSRRDAQPPGGSSLLRQEGDLAWRLRHLPAPPTSLLVVTSGIPGQAADAAAFAALAQPPMILQRASYPGTTQQHAGLPVELAWLADRLSAPVRAR